MTSKDTIDILNRKEFFYYDKPPKTPEIEKQDREQTKKDFELIRKDLEILEILKNNLTIDENYYSQANGSTEAIKLCISNCVSVEEDEKYTDECYPNYDYYRIKEWLEYDK